MTGSESSIIELPGWGAGGGGGVRGGWGAGGGRGDRKWSRGDVCSVRL